MVTELKIDELDLNEVTLVDIRTREEVDMGVIEGAVVICLESREDYEARGFLARLQRVVPEHKKLALLCESGNRSMVLARLLDVTGMDVINVAGGMIYARTCEGIKII